MMIEDKPYAEWLQNQPQQEDGVRRIAALQNAESAMAETFTMQIKLGSKSPAIFQQIPNGG